MTDDFDGPYGLREVTVYSDARWNVDDTLDIKVNDAYKHHILTMIITGSGDVIADAYLENIHETDEAVKWLATLVATRWDRSLDIENLVVKKETMT